MMYQLPNGKVIEISVEEYLALTDEDIQLLMSINAGEYRSSPFCKSYNKSSKKEDVDIESLEYTVEDLEDSASGLKYYGDIDSSDFLNEIDI